MTTKPVLRHRSDLTGSEVWEGDARQVAAAMAPGSCSLAILDGAYGYGKSKVWDAVKMADLPEWYRPHLEDVDRVCGPSASLYFWNTAEGWAAVHPVILSMGWTFRALVVWDKMNVMGSWTPSNGFADQTESCGFYVRGTTPVSVFGGNVWTLCAAGNPSWGGKSLAAERMFSENTKPNIRGGVQRIPLHPCQKPLLFAERMIRASTRPGESVWAPFGGTLREAVAAERIARADPAEARRVITSELNQDGVDYIGPALRQLQGLGTRRVDPRQASLFGGGR
jgi:hypothetical protein